MVRLAFLSNVVWLATFALLYDKEVDQRVKISTAVSVISHLIGCKMNGDVSEILVSFTLSIIIFYFIVMSTLHRL